MRYLVVRDRDVVVISHSNRKLAMQDAKRLAGSEIARVAEAQVYEVYELVHTVEVREEQKS